MPISLNTHLGLGSLRDSLHHEPGDHGPWDAHHGPHHGAHRGPHRDAHRGIHQAAKKELKSRKNEIFYIVDDDIINAELIDNFDSESNLDLSFSSINSSLSLPNPSPKKEPSYSINSNGYLADSTCTDSFSLCLSRKSKRILYGPSPTAKKSRNPNRRLKNKLKAILVNLRKLQLLSYQQVLVNELLHHL